MRDNLKNFICHTIFILIIISFNVIFIIKTKRTEIKENPEEKAG
jgi:hypothetical protein